MTKVLFICDSGALGGAERYIMYSLRCCRMSGYKVDVLTAPSVFSDFLKKMPRDINCLYEKNFNNILTIYRALNDIVGNYALVVAFRWKAIVIATEACKKKKVPLLSTVTTVFEPGTRYDNKNNANIDEKLPYIISENSKRIIAVSESVKLSLIAHGVDESKIFVVYGCSDDYLSVQEKIHSESINTMTITYSGRLSPEKGPDLLIQAIYYLIEKHPWIKGKICVQIMGEGPMKAELNHLIYHYNLNSIVKLIGFVDEPRTYIKNATLHALPSRHDAHPLSGIEATSLGKPLVGFDVGGMHELIKNEKNGYLIPDGDVMSFSEKMYFFLNSPELCNEYGNTSRQIWENNFSFDIFSKHFIRQIRETIEGEFYEYG